MAVTPQTKTCDYCGGRGTIGPNGKGSMTNSDCRRCNGTGAIVKKQ